MNFGHYKAPCADLRCPAHLTGMSRDCECGGWERYVNEVIRTRVLDGPLFNPSSLEHDEGAGHGAVVDQR